MPRLYFAGGGWLTVAVVGMAGLMLFIVFVKYKKSQHKSDYNDHPNYANEKDNVEMKDDDEGSREETQIINNTSIREYAPILN